MRRRNAASGRRPNPRPCSRRDARGCASPESRTSPPGARRSTQEELRPVRAVDPARPGRQGRLRTRPNKVPPSKGRLITTASPCRPPFHHRLGARVLEVVGDLQDVQRLAADQAQHLVMVAAVRGRYADEAHAALVLPGAQVLRCARQFSRLWTSSTSKRRRRHSCSDCSSWPGPERSKGVHTLVAENSLPSCGRLGSSSPRSHCAGRTSATNRSFRRPRRRSATAPRVAGPAPAGRAHVEGQPGAQADDGQRAGALRQGPADRRALGGGLRLRAGQHRCAGAGKELAAVHVTWTGLRPQ